MAIETRAPATSSQPQNLAAEAAVLGAVMVSSEAVERVIDILRPEHFYQRAHAHIYRAARQLFERNDPVDLITLRDELTRLGVLEEIGGPSYLAKLEAEAGIPANVETHAHLVEEAAVRRGLLRAATRIHELGQDHSLEVAVALDQAQKEIVGLATGRPTDEAVALSDSLSEYWDQIERRHEDPSSAFGVRSGFYQLDDMTGGFQPASLIILAARPSVGKTSLALNIAEHVAVKEKVPVAIFSLEMSRFDLTSRFLCATANVDSKLLRTGKLSEGDWSKIANAMGALSEGQIWIDDRPTLTALELRARARRLQVQHRVGLVLVDYIQEVSEISRSLKALARELNLPVIALSQLSRAPEQRADRKPQLSDLRESGSLEQDADVVMFLYREGLHNEQVARNKTELIVAKHRNGPTGDVPLLFMETQTRFVNVTRQTPPGAPAALE
jgi:replicative DNA helicase